MQDQSSQNTLSWRAASARLFSPQHIGILAFCLFFVVLDIRVLGLPSSIWLLLAAPGSMSYLIAELTTTSEVSVGEESAEVTATNAQ